MYKLGIKSIESINLRVYLIFMKLYLILSPALLPIIGVCVSKRWRSTSGAFHVFHGLLYFFDSILI